MWFVYILLCSDDSYYTGISNDPDKRLRDHKNGKGGAYTRIHKAVKIIYKEEYKDKSSALKRENQLKQWSRANKEALIRGDKIALNSI
jgi:putative endonuclease